MEWNWLVWRFAGNPRALLSQLIQGHSQNQQGDWSSVEVPHLPEASISIVRNQRFRGRARLLVIVLYKQQGDCGRLQQLPCLYVGLMQGGYLLSRVQAFLCDKTFNYCMFMSAASIIWNIPGGQELAITSSWYPARTTSSCSGNGGTCPSWSSWGSAFECATCFTAKEEIPPWFSVRL